MRYILIIAFGIFLASCYWRRYPAEKYIIPQKYRQVISSYEAGDTLKFQDSNGNFSTFLITKIDSTLHDKRGYFINAREYKDITIAVHELANARRGYEDYYLLILNKYPDKDSATFDLNLKDFYGIDTTYPFALSKDTVTANNLRFTHYYFFRSRNYSEQKDPNSVTQIYMTDLDGIVAYRCLNGDWWTKTK